MNKKLIQVHSKEDQIKHCSCCDGQSQEVTIFYKELEKENSFGFQTYLNCCVKKMGIVVDWYEYEEYYKKEKEYKLQGINIKSIKGYIA